MSTDKYGNNYEWILLLKKGLYKIVQSFKLSLCGTRQTEYSVCLSYFCYVKNVLHPNSVDPDKDTHKRIDFIVEKKIETKGKDLMQKDQRRTSNAIKEDIKSYTGIGLKDNIENSKTA